MLNWQGGSVYSATVNTYNVRDQVTQVRQYAGVEGSSTYQDTTMTYDGYGRLKTRHIPEQSTNANTVWDYNVDDTIQKITDGAWRRYQLCLQQPASLNWYYLHSAFRLTDPRTRRDYLCIR